MIAGQRIKRLTDAMGESGLDAMLVLSLIHISEPTRPY